MSTRAVIACNNPDGSYDAIYLHFDGTLKHCGAILAQYYTTDKLVKALINLGNLESIGTSLKRKDGTKAFHRDFRQPYVVPFHGKNYHALLNYAEELNVDYIYMWSEGKWSYCGAFGYTTNGRGAWSAVDFAVHALLAD